MANSSGNVKKYKKNKGHEAISRDMLQDEDNLSIEAIGLLANLLSYPDSWELYKTELYKRFKKSKRTKIQNAWNELVEEKYIIQLRKREGKKYNYIYYFQDSRFTEEEIQAICNEEGAELWDGKITKKVNESEEEKGEVDFSTVENQQSNFDSPKSTYKTINNHQEKDYQEKKKDINTDTFKETKKQNTGNSDNRYEQDKELKESLRGSVPDRLFTPLKAFSQSYKQMQEWIGIILRAKDAATKETGFLFTLEDFEYEITKAFTSSIRLYKDEKIKNFNNYLYVAVRDQLLQIHADMDREDNDIN